MTLIFDPNRAMVMVDTLENRGQRSGDSKVKVETNQRPVTANWITFLANAVAISIKCTRTCISRPFQPALHELVLMPNV